MRLRIYLIILTFCIVGSSISQNFSARLFSKAEGLPDAYTYSISKDKTGFLWVSSGKHLVKFDGQVFKKIETKLSAEDIIYSSTLLKSGELWFGTSTGKLISINPENENPEIFPKGCKASIRSIFESAYSEDLFINTPGNGIFIKRKNELIPLKGSDEYEINAVEELERDLLLCGTSEGLFALDLQTEIFTQLKKGEGNIKGVQKLKKKGAFIIYKSTGEFLEIETDNISVTRSTLLYKENSTKEITTFIFNEEDQNLFIATNKEDVTIYNAKTKNSQALNGTNFSASVVSFFRDNETNIWATTVGKGLYRFTQASYNFLNNEPVYAITADKSDYMYYGTKDGISIYDQKGTFIKRVSRVGNKTLGKVNAAYADGKYLWMGTDANGLLLADQFSLKEIQLQFSEVNDISVNSINANGDNILVTTNLDGVYNYKGTMLEDHFSVQNSLLHNNVYHSILDKDGKVYYATHNTAFNYSKGHQLFEIDTRELGLMSDFNAFAQGPEGEIYIATHGDGIYVLKEGAIHPFEFNDLIDSDFCGGVFYDKTHLWIITQYHLYKFYIKEKVLREIKFQDNEQVTFNRLAFYSDERNHVFFGTDKGVVHFKADQKNAKLALPYLLKITMGDSTLAASENSFANGLYNFSFEFSALALKNSEELTFSHKLEGRDESWSAKSDDRKATFSKLGEGEYTLKVIAYNSEGFSSGEVQLYHFTVGAPYWKKAWFWIVIILSLFILFVSFVRARTQQLIRTKEKLEQLVEEKTKQLREEKEIVEKSNKRIEEQSLEIKNSILYAKRIQDALLPDKEQITSRSQNLFVLYQPRDIVSGDFYWGAEINKLKFVAAADCTGHGVPGSLMSMIGSTMLNKIVLERKITRPKDILRELDREIKNALKQHTEDATRDGMDICLCCIDTERRKLIYAGAFRPLFFVRNRQLTEYPPTKSAIGGFSYGKDKEFEETEIDLHKKDTFYLFSDGYADQFGGEKGKKLMLKNLKKLLVSISDKELPEQEENLRRVYNNWKGDLDQVDDVLVIGIRI